MKGILPAILIFLLTVSFAPADEDRSARKKSSPARTSQPESRAAAAFDETMAAQPKLLRISGRIDGSGKITFTREHARYHHKHWAPPTKLLLDGEPWTKLNQTPAAWSEIGKGLDLSKARIVKRKGRDTIALEFIPDGFDLYLNDSPNGAGDYEVIIAIPRR